jgi:molecular chaperone DnaK (HSP70)
MMRLRRECEDAMKSMSTGQEATIDIDSLCEGADYSSKISRARFEDLCSIPIVQLKNLIGAVMTESGFAPADVQMVCMSGGVASMPKILSTVKALFPAAAFPRNRFEFSETQCVGAALHGKHLMQQSLIDNVPTKSPTAPCTSVALKLSSGDDSAAATIAPANTVLPARIVLPASVSQPQGYLKLLGDATPLGEVVFPAEGASAEAPAQVEIVLAVSAEGAITLSVVQKADADVVLGSVDIPASA